MPLLRVRVLRNVKSCTTSETLVYYDFSVNANERSGFNHSFILWFPAFQRKLPKDENGTIYWQHKPNRPTKPWRIGQSRDGSSEPGEIETEKPTWGNLEHANQTCGPTMIIQWVDGILQHLRSPGMMIPLYIPTNVMASTMDSKVVRTDFASTVWVKHKR